MAALVGNGKKKISRNEEICNWIRARSLVVKNKWRVKYRFFSTGPRF